MRPLWKPLASGLLVTILLTLLMLFITINFQYVLVIGTLIFYLSGRMQTAGRLPTLLKALSITWSFLLLFVILVLLEIPELYYIPVVLFLGCYLGLLYGTNKKLSVAGSLLLIVAVIFLSWKVIPADLNNSLTQQINKPLPFFTIKDMKGEVISEKNIEGKIVVFDFFGTWCKPCIQELKELDKVRTAFRKDTTVVFLIVNADLGGDTPEKFDAFIENSTYNFRYAYDEKTNFLKSLELGGIGLPTLIVVDTNTKIRMVHVGYNAAETNFADHLITTIQALQGEE